MTTAKTTTADAPLIDDEAATRDGRRPRPGTTARGRRRRRLRRAVLVAGLTGAALAGTACEPQPAAVCLGVRATIVGTAGNDTLRGTPGPDVIVGRGGRDVVEGLGGGDRLCGGDGNDRLDGGEGDDVVDGGPGGDVTAGGAGTDTIDYGAHTRGVRVELRSGTGPDGDQLSTFENVVGSAHDDALVGDDEPNELTGGRGSDFMLGMGGADSLADRLGSSTDRNIFKGGPGSDTMRGGPDALHDLVAFDDSVVPVFVNLGTQQASGLGEDVWVGMDGVIGGRVGDTIYGSRGRDLIYGDAGDDLIVPFAGDDTVDGEDGTDRVSYYAASRVNVNLTAGRALGEGSDILDEVEDIEGSPGADFLAGNPGPNVIDGNAGVDVCLGEGGTDSLLRCP